MIPTETVCSFAQKRHVDLSFPFLKENTELLSICQRTDCPVDSSALSYYQDFYKHAPEFCRFFPQYFRFILSITLDLEDLGFAGTVSEKICAIVDDQKWLVTEPSPRLRLETVNLLARRQTSAHRSDPYKDQVEKFTFSFLTAPNLASTLNRPMFYDFTHYIFYLTSYGREEIAESEEIAKNLLDMGTLTALDGDTDLLSEICLCLRYISETPPVFWESFVQRRLSQTQIEFDHGAPPDSEKIARDDYHDYLVMNWLMAHKGEDAFYHNLSAGAPIFSCSEVSSILGLISQALYPALVTGAQTTEDSIQQVAATLTDAQRRHFSDVLGASPNAFEVLVRYSHGAINEHNIKTLMG